MIICVRHLRAEFGIDLADPTQLIALGVMSIGNFWKFINLSFSRRNVLDSQVGKVFSCNQAQSNQVCPGSIKWFQIYSLQRLFTVLIYSSIAAMFLKK